MTGPGRVSKPLARDQPIWIPPTSDTMSSEQMTQQTTLQAGKCQTGFIQPLYSHECCAAMQWHCRALQYCAELSSRHESGLCLALLWKRGILIILGHRHLDG